jgi:4-amino-4-deoxy-L-arabinose transferase-like glycosyltransferase
MGHPTVYTKRVFVLIAAFLILRLFTAAILELGNDEAYYWLYSQQLQWNYLDHPPLVALWVNIFTLNGLLSDYEVAIRFGSIVSCAFSTWFLFKAVSLISGELAGWFTACLFNASLYAGLVAGVLVMPDSPQLFFWTFCIWQMAKLIKNDKNKWTWILFGLSAGLCMMSKVHGVFLMGGFVLFSLFKKREWLKQPLFYIAVLLSVLIVSPILIWNMNYDFITFRYHGSRVNITEQQLREESFWAELVSQVMITNPVNFVLIVLGLGWVVKQRNMDPFYVACNFIALPFIFVVIFLSIFRDIWFHWTGPAFVTLLPIAAIRLAKFKSQFILPSAVKWSMALFLVAMLGWPLLVYSYPGTYGDSNKKMHGQGDVTLDKFGWRMSGRYFAASYNESIRKKIITPQTPVVCPTWWGAHIEYYFAREAGAPVIGLGDTMKLGQYNWLNKTRLPYTDMDTALVIEPSIEFGKAPNFYIQYYDKQELLYTLFVFRNGKPAFNFSVSRLTGWKGVNGSKLSPAFVSAYEKSVHVR